MTDTAKVETIEDAARAVKQAIADLKAANIPIPAALYRAAHALHYATDRRP